MKKIGLFLICCLMCAGPASAQQVNITGVVTDANDGSPLIGVTVLVEGTTTATTTDYKGAYAINAKKGDVLAFTYVGKTRETVKIFAQKVVNVKMVDDTNTLDDVVVIGYGTMKKRDVTGSVSQVKGDNLIKGNPSLSVNSALQGKMAGVQVRQNDGAPGGGGISIHVRGANSFSTDTQPLYVIDGLPYGGGSKAPDTGLSGTGSSSNPLANINPNDIESIEVLKDASSTAIYGSRGANGVVIITTKQGRNGKDNITFSSNFSFSKVAKKIDVLDPVTYARYINEQTLNSNPDGQLPYRGEWYYSFDTNNQIITSSANTRPLPRISSARESTPTNTETPTRSVRPTGRTPSSRPDSPRNTTSASTGGNEKGGYLLSFNYTDQTGIIVGSGYKRYAVRSNLWRKMRDWLEVGLNTNYTNSVTNFVNSSTSGGDGVIYSALVFPPTYDATINTQEDNELNWARRQPLCLCPRGIRRIPRQQRLPLVVCRGNALQGSQTA